MPGVWRDAMLSAGRGRHPIPPALDGDIICCGTDLLTAECLLFFPGLLRGCYRVERLLDVGDHAGGDAGVACCAVELVVTEERVDDFLLVPCSSRRVVKWCRSARCCHALLHSGAVSAASMEQLAQRPGVVISVSPAVPAGKQLSAPAGAFLRRIVPRWARLPRLPQQHRASPATASHDRRSSAPLRLLHPDDLLRAVDMPNLQPDHLARTAGRSA